MLWVIKRTASMGGSFEHPKHMLKLMAKKIFTILRSKNCLSKHMNQFTGADHVKLLLLQQILFPIQDVNYKQNDQK